MKTKFMFSTVLAVIFLAVQVFAVGAAPLVQDETPPSSSIESITWGTNPDTTETAVVVTYTDAEGASQTVYLTVEEATQLGLVITNEAGEQVTNDEAVGDPFEYDPTTAGGEEGITEEENQHPVGSALSDFFYDVLGVDYGTVMTYHDDGVGFGTIAQALWMTNALGGDSSTFSLILDAKQSHDYSLITLPDGSTPKNWGQFRTAVMKDKDKAMMNLGAVKSGRAGSQGDTTNPSTGQGNGKKPDKENGVKNQNDDDEGKTGIGTNGNSNKDQTGIGAGNGKNKDNDKSNNGNNKDKGDKGKSEDKGNKK